MYEEIVKELRNLLIAYKATDNGNCHQAKIIAKAADAIEELVGKATPKRVGFTKWKGYRDTRYKCPFCNKNVRNDEAYCHKCGQALMFPHIDFTPYVPGEVQQVIVSWPDESPEEK